MADHFNRPQRNYYSSSTSNRQPYYKASHPTYYKRTTKTPYGIRLLIQSLIAGSLLVGVLLIQKLPMNESNLYEQIKTEFLSAFSYGPMNEWLNQNLNGAVFPTIANKGQADANGDTVTAMGLIDNIQKNIAIEQYGDGIIVNVAQKEPIFSLEGGTVQHMGTDDLYGNYIIVQLDNGAEMTIGFLENRSVSLYQRIAKNEVLGVGTEVDEEAYYYLAVEKDGVFLDLNHLLANLELLD